MFVHSIFSKEAPTALFDGGVVPTVKKCGRCFFFLHWSLYRASCQSFALRVGVVELHNYGTLGQKNSRSDERRSYRDRAVSPRQSGDLELRCDARRIFLRRTDAAAF